MVGTIFVSTYLISIVYNTIKLNKIRKDTIKKCEKILIIAGYEVNPSKIKYILDFTTYRKIDEIGYIMLSYMPFGSYKMWYLLVTNQIQKEYDLVSEDILTPKMLFKLENAEIIRDSKMMKRLTEEERKKLEKTHQIYKPDTTMYVTGRERLMDDLPVEEELTLEDIQKLDTMSEENKGKVYKKIK